MEQSKARKVEAHEDTLCNCGAGAKHWITHGVSCKYAAARYEMAKLEMRRREEIIAETTRKVEAHKLSRKIAAHFFPDEDTKVFMHGHNRGWCNFDEVVEIVAQIIADHAPAETTKDATSGQGEQDGQGNQFAAGMDSGCASGHLGDAAVHPLRPDSDSRQAQVGGAVEQAGAGPQEMEQTLITRHSLGKLMSELSALRRENAAMEKALGLAHAMIHGFVEDYESRRPHPSIGYYAAKQFLELEAECAELRRKVEGK